MSWREEIESDWFYEAPFYLTAIIAHGALLTLNPVVRWGSAERALDKVVPVEFVTEIPLPPGEFETETVKKGAVDPPPKLKPSPKPAAKPAVDARAVKFAREAQAESKRLRAERRVTALAEQKRLAAETKAAKAAKRAELSSALATMDDPDEVLEAGASEGGGKEGGEAALAGARKAAAAAALAESADPGDAAGSGGADLLDSKARGGGPEGGGVSWSVDGPVGSRRLLSRVSPTSPDWVATRNLDLTVTIRFHVLPDGSVAPGAVISKTSGFPEIDRLALDALRRWRFQSVAKAGTPEVWGRVTFRFTS